MNFSKLLENIDKKEAKSMLAIRNGMGIRDKFWDDFLLLLNDAESLAELLGVSIEKVSTWRSKIHNALKNVKSSDATLIPREKGKLLKTGLPENI